MSDMANVRFFTPEPSYGYRERAIFDEEPCYHCAEYDEAVKRPAYIAARARRMLGR